MGQKTTKLLNDIALNFIDQPVDAFIDDPTLAVRTTDDLMKLYSLLTGFQVPQSHGEGLAHDQDSRIAAARPFITRLLYIFSKFTRVLHVLNERKNHGGTLPPSPCRRVIVDAYCRSEVCPSWRG